MPRNSYKTMRQKLENLILFKLIYRTLGNIAFINRSIMADYLSNGLFDKTSWLNIFSLIYLTDL